MSDNKLVKTIMDVATLTGLAAGIGWIAKKVVKENFISDPSSNVMNYAKFTAVMAGSVTLNSTSKTRRFFHPVKKFKQIAICANCSYRDDDRKRHH